MTTTRATTGLLAAAAAILMLSAAPSAAQDAEAVAERLKARLVEQGSNITWDSISGAGSQIVLVGVKAGPVGKRPRFATPYMPRLDWQLWFAALGPPERNVWLFMMMSRLGEGSPAVLALLEDNPFPESPPRYLRAIRYDYTFSDFETLRTTGAWWQRERIGPYGPILEPAKP